MDNKNVFVAIALSMAVLLFWGAFFETPRQVKENQTLDKVQTNQKEPQNDITPKYKPRKNYKKNIQKRCINRSGQNYR